MTDVTIRCLLSLAGSRAGRLKAALFRGPDHADSASLPRSVVDRVRDAISAGGLLSGGYSETKLAPDSYQIFAETESLERTGQMLDLRPAELTLESGYRRFAVVDRVVNNEHRTHYIPGYTSYGGGLRAAPMVMPPRMETVTVAKGKMTIKMLKGSESGAAKAIDAAAVRARLQPLLTGR
jgi:hypothetical protein